MSRTRRSNFAAFNRLTPEAQALVLESLERGMSQPQIRAKLAAETGESFSSGAISRFAEHWARQKEQYEQVGKAAKLMVERGLEIGDAQAKQYCELLIQTGLLANQDRIHEVSLEGLLKERRQFLALEIKRKELEIKRGKLEMAERQLQLFEAKERRLQAKIEALEAEFEKAAAESKATKTVKPETLERIRREVYGLKEAAA